MYITITFICNSITNHAFVSIDPCDECPLNSTCDLQSDNNVLCICPDGYSGKECDNFTAFCDPNPCLNNGTCMEITNHFTCLCLPMLTGVFCEVDLNDECDPNPCVNGNCIEFINSYKCTCFDDFTDYNYSQNS